LKQNVDGSNYTGDWLYGEATGEGVKQIQKQIAGSSKTADYTYKGTWLNNELVKGICTYPSGDIYEGDWNEGKPEGQGIKTWADGRKYEG
jgi:hypothetical protein